jgi:hypothetical protein
MTTKCRFELTVCRSFHLIFSLGPNRPFSDVEALPAPSDELGAFFYLIISTIPGAVIT